MRAQMGGLVMVAKVDEIELWKKRAEIAGRSDDLLIVGPGSPHHFNFLQHEIVRHGAGAGQSENIANLIEDVVNIAERASGKTSQEGGGGNEAYFRRAGKALTKDGIDVLKWAGEEVSIPNLHAFISTMPKTNAQMASPSWQRQSYYLHCMTRADEQVHDPKQRRDLKVVADFGMREWPELSDKTQTSISSTVTFATATLARGELRTALCENTTITPEAAADGKIIVLGMPIREWGDVGQLFQTVWKLMFMRDMERRVVRENPRPVFLFADETQNFLIPKYDAQFQATCRSQRVAVVLAAQNLPSYYCNLANGDKGKSEADALLACLNTHIYHCNTCSVTNQWASARAGQCKQYLFNGHSGPEEDDAFSLLTGTGSSSTNGGFSESWEAEIQPSEFTRLRAGGPENNWLADASVVQANSIFKTTGKIWLTVTISQR
jgi:hypothetical protein